MAKPILSIECCEEFPKVMNAFTWMSYKNKDGEDVLCMPHFEVTEELKLRVNYCPCCGKEVRAIELHLKE